MNSTFLQKLFSHSANPLLLNQDGNGLGLTRSKSKLESLFLGNTKVVNVCEKVRVGQYDPLFLFYVIIILNLIKKILEGKVSEADPSSLYINTLGVDIFE